MEMKYKYTTSILLYLLLVFSAISCSFSGRYIVMQTGLNGSHAGSLPVEEINKKYRIALVGFYPYEKKVIDTYRDREISFSKYRVTLDYAHSLKSEMKIGVPIDDIPETGIAREVPLDRIKSFIDVYMSQVKESGIDEMTKLFAGQQGALRLKNRGVDYYLVGIHQPFYNRLSPRKKHLSNFTHFLHAITFGTIPVEHYYEKNSIFYLYDRDLNRVKEFKYTGEYVLKSAWWMRSDPEGTKFKTSWQSEMPPAMIWAPDAHRLTGDLAQFFSSK